MTYAKGLHQARVRRTWQSKVRTTVDENLKNDLMNRYHLSMAPLPGNQDGTVADITFVNDVVPVKPVNEMLKSLKSQGFAIVADFGKTYEDKLVFRMNVWPKKHAPPSSEGRTL